MCEVCHRERDVWVASGALGPYSIARCQECLQQYAEPIWAVEAILMMVGGSLKNCNEYFPEVVTWHPRKNNYVQVKDLHVRAA